MIWAFLTKERGTKRAARPQGMRTRKQRGIALIAVLVVITIILVMTTQFSTNTNIDMFAAANHRDQMRAHFLARSAQNLSELVIRLQQRIDNIKELRGQVQITDFADQVLLAFCGGGDEVMNATGFKPGQVKGLGAEVGTCGIVGQQISTEDDKLNVNCLNGNINTAKTYKSALDAMVFFEAYSPVFEEADAKGWRRDRPTQVCAIVDYIDSNGVRCVDERGTTEDYGYESLKDPYRPKNNYIDSVGELKMVRGVDDRFWTLFGSGFTAYGACKINLSSLTNTQLIAAVLLLAAKDPKDPVVLDPKKLFTLASIVARAKQFGQAFTTVDDFIKFVKDPAAELGSLAGQGATMAGSQATAAVNAGIPGLTGSDRLKLELDKAKLQQMTTAGPRRTYRVKAYGEIPRQGKDRDGKDLYPPIRVTVDAVWDTKVVPQNARKTPAPKGAWVYMRED
jgi:general secretion pathway protein K